LGAKIQTFCQAHFILEFAPPIDFSFQVRLYRRLSLVAALDTNAACECSVRFALLNGHALASAGACAVMKMRFRTILVWALDEYDSSLPTTFLELPRCVDHTRS